VGGDRGAVVTSDEEAASGGAGRGGKQVVGGDEAVGGGKGEAPRLVTVKLTQLASDRWTNGTRVREAPTVPPERNPRATKNAG